MFIVELHREHISFRNYRLVPDPTEVWVDSRGRRSGILFLENRAHGFTCRDQHREDEKASSFVMCGTSKTVCSIFEGGAGSIWLSLPI